MTSIISEALPELVELAARGATLSIPEASKLADVAPRTTRSWIFCGKGGRYLRAYRFGTHGRLRTSARELLEFLEHTAVEDRNRGGT